MFHSEYRGQTIWRNTEPGHALRWTSSGSAGRLAADTLAGLKGLIRKEFV